MPQQQVAPAPAQQAQVGPSLPILAAAPPRQQFAPQQQAQSFAPVAQQQQQRTPASPVPAAAQPVPVQQHFQPAYQGGYPQGNPGYVPVAPAPQLSAQSFLQPEQKVEKSPGLMARSVKNPILLVLSGGIRVLLWGGMIAGYLRLPHNRAVLPERWRSANPIAYVVKNTTPVIAISPSLAFVITETGYGIYKARMPANEIVPVAVEFGATGDPQFDVSYNYITEGAKIESPAVEQKERVAPPTAAPGAAHSGRGGARGRGRGKNTRQ